jgi:hypothetical protein
MLRRTPIFRGGSFLLENVRVHSRPMWGLVMRAFIVLLLLLLLLLFPAGVLADGVDGQFVCPVISEELARRIAAEIKGSGGCSAFCRGCGCKGGPGCRDQRGQCVGYAQLITRCGPPPPRRKILQTQSGPTPSCSSGSVGQPAPSNQRGNHRPTPHSMHLSSSKLRQGSRIQFRDLFPSASYPAAPRKGYQLRFNRSVLRS